MHPARLFVLCGPPGNTVSHRAVELAERFRATRLSADDEMASLAGGLLRAGQSLVVEWGAWERARRDELLATARAAGAFAHLEHLDTRSSTEIEPPTADELATFDPWPVVRAGEHPGSPAFPYGSWRP